MVELVRLGFVPLVLFGCNGLAMALVAAGWGVAALAPLLALTVALSFLAERIAPYRPVWQRDHGDGRRDVAHALVNETLHLVTLALLPLVAPAVALADLWPRGWPFALQVVTALVVLDFGVTLCHWASHKIDLLWRFHAVHHSVERMYGFNGLMKHPVHQSIESLCGTAPLLLVGVPPDVALAMIFCVSSHLLLQHSNVAYRIGPLRHLLALNQTHRFHHLRHPSEGDVNFGLVTHLWDHVLRTFHYDPSRAIDAGDLGMASEPDYPRSYLAQLWRPFSPIAAS